MSAVGFAKMESNFGIQNISCTIGILTGVSSASKKKSETVVIGINAW